MIIYEFADIYLPALAKIRGGDTRDVCIVCFVAEYTQPALEWKNKLCNKGKCALPWMFSSASTGVFFLREDSFMQFRIAMEQEANTLEEGGHRGGPSPRQRVQVLQPVLHRS